MRNWNPCLHLAKHQVNLNCWGCWCFPPRFAAFRAVSNSARSNPRFFLPGLVLSHPSAGKFFAKAANIPLMAMSLSLQVSVMVTPMDVSFPVFSEAAYHPAPLPERTPPDTFVVEISALYELPVSYSIASGDEKGELLMWNNNKHSTEHWDCFFSPSFFSKLSSTAINPGWEWTQCTSLMWIRLGTRLNFCQSSTRHRIQGWPH